MQKLVDDDGTKRECVSDISLLDTASLLDTTAGCTPTPNNHVCMTDKCNTGSGLRHSGLVAMSAAAILALVVGRHNWFQ
jgi:hypothetical protein